MVLSDSSTPTSSRRRSSVDGFALWAITPEFELLGGVRYFENDLHMRLKSVNGVKVSSKDSQTWADPMIGARLIHPLSQNWLVEVRADIGGFGVQSQFEWNAEGLFGYRLSNTNLLWAGYRALDVDYKEGSPANRYTFDVRMEGFVGGASWTF